MHHFKSFLCHFLGTYSIFKVILMIQLNGNGLTQENACLQDSSKALVWHCWDAIKYITAKWRGLTGIWQSNLKLYPFSTILKCYMCNCAVTVCKGFIPVSRGFHFFTDGQLTIHLQLYNFVETVCYSLMPVSTGVLQFFYRWTINKSLFPRNIHTCCLQVKVPHL